MKMKFITFIGFLTSAALFLSACQAAPDAARASGSSGVQNVLAVESFLADMAQQVAGDRLKVDTLVPLGLDPHAFEPTPRDVARIAESQVLIVNGAGFEGWLEKTLANAGGQRTLIEASAGLRSRAAREGETAVLSPEEQAGQVCATLEAQRAGEEVRAGAEAASAAGLPGDGEAGEEEHALEPVRLRLAGRGEGFGGFVRLVVNEAGDTLIAAGAGEVQVLAQDGSTVEVESSLPVTCAGFTQGLVLELAPGQYTVALNGFTAETTPFAAGALGGHAHEGGDPHFWLDPVHVVRYVENIRDGLSAADPAGKEAYAQNAAAYIERLKALDGWIKSQVEQIPPDRRQIITNHESFGYFADRYGFKIIGTILPSVSTDASPSAQQMARLVDGIRSTGATAIFLETGSNPKLAEQIAEETGVKVVSNLYTHSVTRPGAEAPGYIEMMEANVKRIVEALK